MFYNCQALTKLDVSAWNMQRNKNIQMMFYWCLNLPELDTSAWTLSPEAKTSSFSTGASRAFGHLLSLTELDVTKLGHCYHKGMVELNTLKVSDAAGNEQAYPAALETLKMNAYKDTQSGPNNSSVTRDFTQTKDFHTSFILPEKSHWNVYRLDGAATRQKKIATYDTDAAGLMQMTNVNPRITETESLQQDTNYEFHMAHKLTFDPNGGTLASGTLDYTYVDRHGVVKADGIVDKTAHPTGKNPQAQIAAGLTPPAEKGKFLYWSTTPDGSSDALAIGMTITKDVTLYAIYAPKSQPTPPTPPAPNPQPTPGKPAPKPEAPAGKPTRKPAVPAAPTAKLPKTGDVSQAMMPLVAIFSAAGVVMARLHRRNKA